MFTGIITAIGVITEAKTHKEGLQIAMETAYPKGSIKVGDSVSCNGVCLTATSVKKGKHGLAFTADLSPETLEKTTLHSLKKGAHLNLELAMKLGDTFGGHIVSGHVDGLGVVKRVKEYQDYHLLEIKAPKKLMKLIAPKGSITVDGVSLTVNDVNKQSFELMIIPHTWKETTCQFYEKGTEVNLEVDLIARYVARILGK